MRPSPRFSAVSLILAACLGGCAHSSNLQSRTARPQHGNIGTSHLISRATTGSGVAPTRSGPLPGGVLSTLENARSQLRFPVATPNDTLANQQNLVQVWVDRKAQQVALIFDGGSVTLMMWRSTYPDPAAAFAEDAATFSLTDRDPTGASVTTVHGSDPALAIKPNIDA